MDFYSISSLKVGVKNVSLAFIVLEVGKTSTTKDGHEIRTCKVADRSACINLSVWDDIGNYIQPGDIFRLTKGYVALWKNIPTLYMGRGGELVKTGEFALIFNEAHNMSDPTQNQQGVPTTISTATPTSTNKMDSNSIISMEIQ